MTLNVSIYRRIVTVSKDDRLNMTLAPTIDDLIHRARMDLRAGLPVIMGNGADQIILGALETLSRARFDALKHMPGAAIALSDWRAKALKMPVYDTGLTRFTVPGDLDFATAQALADPSRDLARPLKGPFQYIRDSHNETAAHALRLVKAAHILPSIIYAPLHGANDASLNDLTALPSLPNETLILEDIVAARVPIVASAQTRLHVFRERLSGDEHYAVEIGHISPNAPTLTRVHSACFTGDVLGSLKCDCGPQLNAALAQMGAAGGGLLLYLNQEGRGIGLPNKMRAYALQDQGFDTVDANHRLGFEDDERDFRLGAQMLNHFNIERIQLLTNNPRKLGAMQDQGITVTERVPLIVGKTDENAKYLKVKAEKSGHVFDE